MRSFAALALVLALSTMVVVTRAADGTPRITQNAGARAPPAAPIQHHAATASVIDAADTRPPPPLKRQGATRDLHQLASATGEPEALLSELIDEVKAIRPDVLAAVGGTPQQEGLTASGSTIPPLPTATTAIGVSSPFLAGVVAQGTRLSHSLLAHLSGLIWPTPTDRPGAIGGSRDGRLDTHTVWDHYSDASLWVLLAIGVATLVVRDLLLR